MLISKFGTYNNEADINNMENRYKITLPLQYKNFLRDYNGGYTSNTRFKIRTISSDIKGFFGTGNVEMSFDSIDIQNWSIDGYLPIASDSFGNYIILSVAGIQRGKIYFWDHEQRDYLELIAENFAQFVAICKSERINEVSVPSIKEREEALIAKGRGHIITDGLRKMWQAEIDKHSRMIQEEVVIR